MPAAKKGTQRKSTKKTVKKGAKTAAASRSRAATKKTSSSRQAKKSASSSRKTTARASAQTTTKRSLHHSIRTTINKHVPIIGLIAVIILFFAYSISVIEQQDEDLTGQARLALVSQTNSFGADPAAFDVRDDRTAAVATDLLTKEKARYERSISNSDVEGWESGASDGAAGSGSGAGNGAPGANGGAAVGVPSSSSSAQAVTYPHAAVAAVQTVPAGTCIGPTEFYDGMNPDLSYQNAPRFKQAVTDVVGEVYVDRCLPNGQLQQYICQQAEHVVDMQGNSIFRDGVQISTAMDCPAGTRCLDGACV